MYQTPLNFRSHVHIIHVLDLILCAAHLAASYTGDIHELLTLRDSFADARDVLPSWFDTLTPPCKWHGVQCKADMVESLDLSGVTLGLPFPKCITEFRALQILNFSNCGFTGQIPENIENLQNLQYLDLSKNRLSGPLPSSLAKMKLLRKLSVGENSLSGSLTPDLRKLQNLEILDLSVNSFSGILPSSLANLTGLQQLEDASGDVFGLAVKCLTPLVKKVHDDRVLEMTNKLCDKLLNGKDQHRDITSIALKIIVAEIATASLAQRILVSLGPQLIKGTITSGNSTEIQCECLDILCNVLHRFGNLMAKDHEELVRALLSQLVTNQASVRKKSISCICISCPELVW